MTLIIISTILFAVALFTSIALAYRLFHDTSTEREKMWHTIFTSLMWAVFYFVTQFLNYA